MQVHNVQQGTAEWLALRANYFTASEAPIMMGVSPYMTRTELLHAKKTGIMPEITPQMQKRFDDGHATEAAFRPIAEEIIGADLYPVTGSIEVDGLKLLASFDGLTADDAIGFEHKLWNESVAESIQAGELLPDKYWQLEQELLVSGAEKILFVTSDGTRDKCKWLYYHSLPERRAALIAGWKQFAVDLETYVPEAKAEPAPIGRAPESLPALRIEVTGMVTASNLQLYKDSAIAVFRSINRELTTDQHFSDAAKTVAWCSDIEERIKAAKQHALSQTESIDLLFRTMDEISAEARTVRLDLSGVIKRRKEDVKTDIVNAARVQLVEHLESLNKRWPQAYLASAPADFAGAIRGKSSVDNMRDAVSSVLANAKVEANRRADAIDQNIKYLESKAAECMSIFADKNQLVLHDPELFALKVDARISDHKQAEQKRLEAEREKIRTEELAKIARETEEAVAKAAKDAADAAAAALKAAEPVSQPNPETAAPAAPVVASVSPEKPHYLDAVHDQYVADKKLPDGVLSSPVANSSTSRGGAILQSPLSQAAVAFLASREWPNQSTKQTARATLIEFEKFCAQQDKAAA